MSLLADAETVRQRRELCRGCDHAVGPRPDMKVICGMCGCALVGKVRLAWFCGPHLLSDEPTPYRHHHFPYVPFFGFREDRTGVPYGMIRGMIFLQDEVNARISKMQWLLSARSTIRTDGIVLQDDEEFRQMVGRPDADIILDPAVSSQPGARFDIERNFELNRQQFDRLQHQNRQPNPNRDPQCGAR